MALRMESAMVARPRNASQTTINTPDIRLSVRTGGEHRSRMVGVHRVLLEIHGVNPTRVNPISVL